MSKNTYWILGSVAIFIAVIVMIGISVSSNSSIEDTDSNSGVGELSFSEDDWDIGTISMKDGFNTKEISMSNVGDASIVVKELLTSCMCTTVQVVRADGSKSLKKGMPGHGGTTRVSEKIAPGEVVTLRVVFDPNAHGPDATGLISRKVILRTESKLQPEITLNFDGNVTK